MKYYVVTFTHTRIFGWLGNPLFGEFKHNH